MFLLGEQSSCLGEQQQLFLLSARGVLSLSFLTFHSHFSLFSLFSPRVFVMAPVYFIGIDIYVLIFQILYAFYIYLPYFTWHIINIYSIFIFTFLEFIRYDKWTSPTTTTRFPPWWDEPFALDIVILDFPVLAIVWNIFQPFSVVSYNVCIHWNNILHIYVAVYFPGRVAAISTYHVHAVEHHWARYHWCTWSIMDMWTQLLYSYEGSIRASATYPPDGTVDGYQDKRPVRYRVALFSGTSAHLLSCA